MNRYLKKVLSVLIIAALIITQTSLSFAEKDGTLFTVTTDTHFRCDSDLSSLYESENKYTKGMLNEDVYASAAVQGQMNFESGAIMNALLKDFVSSDSRVLLICGDLTCGKKVSHEEFAKMLAEAKKKSGKEIYVVPGNHDCAAQPGEDAIDINGFKELYADFGLNQAVSTEPTSASYCVDLPGNVRLFAIDSCIYGKDDGQITDSVFSWLQTETKAAREEGKTLIAMMHHSILPHFELQPMIKNGSKYAEEFIKMGINTVFTGHIHANDISCTKTDNGTLYDVQTGSLITSPCAYRNVTVGSGKVRIESRYIEKIDTGDLNPGYYSEGMIQTIGKDFQTYAYTYFEAGICRWINRYLGSAWKVGRLMKLKEGETGYEILDRIMGRIGDGFAVPLYSDGKKPFSSIEDFVNAGGYEMPESSYKMMYQPAAKVINAFYHGDEDMFLNSKDTELLFISIKGALTYLICENAGITNPDVIAAVCRTVFSDSIYTELADALIFTLAGGFVNDLSYSEDINTEFEISNTGDMVPVYTDTFKRVIHVLFKLVKNILSEVTVNV